MKYSILLFLSLLLLSCSDNERPIDDLQEEAISFRLSENTEVIIQGSNIPSSFITSLQESLESRMAGSVFNSDRSIFGNDSNLKSRSEANFIERGKYSGVFYWDGDELDRVTHQAFYVYYAADDPDSDMIVIFVTDRISSKGPGLLEFDKRDFDRHESFTPCSVVAEIFGGKTDIFKREELLQSETRNLGKFANCPKKEVSLRSGK